MGEFGTMTKKDDKMDPVIEALLLPLQLYNHRSSSFYTTQLPYPVYLDVQIAEQREIQPFRPIVFRLGPSAQEEDHDGVSKTKAHDRESATISHLPLVQENQLHTHLNTDHPRWRHCQWYCPCLELRRMCRR
jgi:hypothetical protein